MLRDITGRTEESLDLPAAGPLASVFEHYAIQFPSLRQLEPSIVLAQNQQFADRSSVVSDGDEIAFLPPVSGGVDARFIACISDEATGNFFALTREAVDTAGVARRLLRGEDGAVVQFEGVVRNNTKGRATRFLDYEGYEAMAAKVMADIGRKIAQERQIGRIAMVHRLGRMEIGETSVAVVVTAPHRRPAFEAALEGIDQLKKLVPIWKKEHFEDGEVWVEGEWDEKVLSGR